jgi:hypothetical protein
MSGFWASLQDMHQSTVDDPATVGRASAGGQDSAAEAAAKVAFVKQRIERIKRGEDEQGGLVRQGSGGCNIGTRSFFLAKDV